MLRLRRINITLIGIVAVFLLGQRVSMAQDESVLFWPPPPAEMRIVYVSSINSPQDIGVKKSFFKKLKSWISGVQKDFFYRPVAVAVDREGTLFISDPEVPAVHILNARAGRYTKLTKIQAEELVSPVGVAVSPEGTVCISDSVLVKVFCLDRRYKLKFIVGPEEKIERPTGLAFHDEQLYVVDTAGHRVLTYDRNGRFISAFGERGKGPGKFNYPTSIAIDPEGRWYVVDALNFRIQVFDPQNRFLANIGSAGDVSGSFARPKGVAIDTFGHVYITDGLSENVQVFNQNKEFLMSWGEAGQNPGEFWIASGIAIDDENTIYIADSYNQRIQVFRYVGSDE